VERVSVTRMATAKPQGGIHAARGMGVSGSVTTELNRYKVRSIYEFAGQFKTDVQPIQPLLESHDTVTKQFFDLGHGFVGGRHAHLLRQPDHRFAAIGNNQTQGNITGPAITLHNRL